MKDLLIRLGGLLHALAHFLIGFVWILYTILIIRTCFIDYTAITTKEILITILFLLIDWRMDKGAKQWYNKIKELEESE